MSTQAELDEAVKAAAHACPVTYVKAKHNQYGVGDMAPDGVDSGVDWYKQVLLPPKQVPICTGCHTDLQRWKRITREVQKHSFKYDCSSPWCLWHDWFEVQRPPDFAKWHIEARLRRMCAGK